MGGVCSRYGGEGRNSVLVRRPEGHNLTVHGRGILKYIKHINIGEMNGTVGGLL